MRTLDRMETDVWSQVVKLLGLAGETARGIHLVRTTMPRVHGKVASWQEFELRVERIAGIESSGRANLQVGKGAVDRFKMR